MSSSISPVAAGTLTTAVAAPVSAITTFGNALLIGMAHTLRVYEVSSGSLLLVQPVLTPGEVVHGLQVSASSSFAHQLLVLFGLRELHAVELELHAHDRCRVVPILNRRFARRVLCTISHPSRSDVLEDAQARNAADVCISVGCDDNAVSTSVVASCAGRLGEAINTACDEAPLLYAMALSWRDADCGGAPQLLAIAGSAFRTILVWDATPDVHQDRSRRARRRPLYRLDGHSGALFRVRFSPSGRRAVSTSDDRRIIVWQLPDRASTVTSAAQDTCKLAKEMATASVAGEVAWFAHGARVWDCEFVRERTAELEPSSCQLILASCGEDAAVKVWRVSLGNSCAPARDASGARSAAVELLATLKGHAGKHVWCVAAFSTGDADHAFALASGGADCSVRLWPLQQYLSAHDSSSTPASTPTNAAALLGDDRSCMRSTEDDGVRSGREQRCGRRGRSEPRNSCIAFSLPALVQPGHAASAPDANVEINAPIRALALADPSRVILATASGCVWLVHLTAAAPVAEVLQRSMADGGANNDTVIATDLEVPPPCLHLLHSSPGVRWSKVQVTSVEGGVLVSLGSACGETLLIATLMSPGNAARSYGSLWDDSIEIARWRAHSTCIMQFQWAELPSLLNPERRAVLVSADATGEIALWRVACNLPLAAAAAEVNDASSSRPSSAQLRERLRLLPCSQRVSSVAATPLPLPAVACAAAGAERAICVLFCGGSAGSLRVHAMPYGEPCDTVACSDLPVHGDVHGQASVGDGILVSCEPSEAGLLVHAHGGQPVTDLLLSSTPTLSDWRATDASSVSTMVLSFFSCGRNGVVNENECVATYEPVNGRFCVQLRLSVLRSWRCTSMTILESLHPIRGGGLAVLGFLQNEALLWEVHSRQELVRLPTKGYRHPKDILLVEHSGGRQTVAEFHQDQLIAVPCEATATLSLKFAYATGTNFHLHSFANNFVASGVENGNKNQGSKIGATSSEPASGVLEHLNSETMIRSLHHNLHGREVLCAEALAISFENGHCHQLFATGSEDNTVKLITHSIVSHADGAECQGSLQVDATLEGHPASIRALASCSDGAARILFSVGGKEAIHVWSLTQSESVSTPGADMGRQTSGWRTRLLCAHVRAERNASTASSKAVNDTARREEADSRYLSAAAVAIGDTTTDPAWSHAGCSHVLALGTSQGQVDVFVLRNTPAAASLVLIARVPCLAGPLLCMTLEHYQCCASGSESALVLVGGSTGGELTVWDLRPLLTQATLSFVLSIRAHGRKSAAAMPMCVAAAQTVPPCCSVQVHTMGVNCLSYLPCGQSMTRNDQCLLYLATGGDDQAVAIHKVSLGSKSADHVHVDLQMCDIQRDVHSAGVRGVTVAHHGETLLSVGADSRIIAWHVRANGAIDLEGMPQLQRLWSINLAIEQVHGICMLSSCGEESAVHVRAESHVVIIGCGIQVIRLPSHIR